MISRLSSFKTVVTLTYTVTTARTDF